MEAALLFLKNLLSSELGRTIIIVIVAFITAVSVSYAIYSRGYTSGYNVAVIEHEKEMAQLIESHNKMEDSLEILAKALKDKDAEIVVKLDTKLTSILKGVKGMKLTTPECNPSKEFIGGWNEITNTANSSLAR